MEIYSSNDGQVNKYVHDNGAETAIKTVSSCQNIVDPVTGKMVSNEFDKGKVSIFVSSSVGCPIGCKFCYLTAKKFPYHKLSDQEIFDNVMEAVQAAIEDYPSILNRYVKLSWMGMGDVFLRDPVRTKHLTLDMLSELIHEVGFWGLDGVDIGTVLPHTARGWPWALADMNEFLMDWGLNPNNKDGRSPVRLFYSLHAAVDKHRRKLIPIHKSLQDDLDKLKRLYYDFGIDVICHHMFLEGINDDYVPDVGDFELRILRFNECENSPYKESPKFNELVQQAITGASRVKYQISAGSEIKAACGQFICKAS